MAAADADEDRATSGARCSRAPTPASPRCSTPTRRPTTRTCAHRGTFTEVDGVVQPAPAPRFSRTPGPRSPGPRRRRASTPTRPWRTGGSRRTRSPAARRRRRARAASRQESALPVGAVVSKRSCTSGSVSSSRTSTARSPTRTCTALELGLAARAEERRLRLGVGLRAPLLRLPADVAAVDGPVVARRADARGSSWARSSRSCPGTTRCGWPSSSRCSTTCPAGGRSSASAVVSARRSSTASAWRWASRGGGSRSTARPSSRRSRPGVIEYDGELYQQPRGRDPARPARQLQGPHVRVGGVAGVDGDHGPHGRRAHGDRPEAVGDHRGRARGLPRALPRAQRRRGAQADAGRRGRREQGPGAGRADARGLPAALGPLDRRALRVRQRRASPRSRATSTTAPWPTTSTSTASSASTASSPTCRCGARPSRSPRSCSTTSSGPTPAGSWCRCASAACPPTRRHANFDLFATEVLPELQRHDVGGDLGVTYDAPPAAVA